ncbi:MAG: hypothetical protein AVDCRST_MAG96-3955 [uncultured Segetibacter sp.]|uniref:Uncharacterized protein n=1 Tax=uncultured Segetibacter sp. TaxID=481133 RepID=A0A6J4U2E4_9BACT|nr:MAG: hypothetical protein AVDCRST_MAG96-3955 [uncultured Segetibacter sp.]
MISKVAQQDSDANNANDYFNAMRQKNYEASFEGVKNFMQKNEHKLLHCRPKQPLRNWQLILAVLFPVLVVLACTKTERTEPVGNTVSFSVPEHDDAARTQLESLIGGLQTVVLADKQKAGYLSYTCFIPAENSRPADAVIGELKAIKGIAGLSSMPVNAQVRESLLSQVGYKIFSTHVDATAMRDDEMQNTVMRQLKEKGFNNISVTVTRNEKGVRTLQLHPAEDAGNYFIDLSIDDKGTKMVLQEENRRIANKPKIADKPKVNFGRMTDAQVRDYIRSQYGKQLRDENIKVTRTSEEIAIDIKQSDKKEEIMRFRLN